MVITYIRLFVEILINPGYIPRSARWYKRAEDERESRSRKKHSKRFKGSHLVLRDKQKDAVQEPDLELGHGHQMGRHSHESREPVSLWPDLNAPPPGIERFYEKDVFVCEATGRPIWCHYCLEWKFDRAHHNSESDRCVRKLDHFCPW